MKKLFKNNTILFSPDIVTYLDNYINLKKIKRNGALILLRKDNETLLNNNFKKKILDLIQKKFDKISYSDNQIDKIIETLEQSKKEVSEKLKEIASYEIVITDRLHGMIFSGITQTSCIVLSNYNHKISSSFQLFKNLKYIKFLDDFDIKRFEFLVNILKNKKSKNIYNKNIFNKYYNILIKYFLNNSYN